MNFSSFVCTVAMVMLRHTYYVILREVVRNF